MTTVISHCLPLSLLPSTGDNGAVLESIDSDDEDVSEPGEYVGCQNIMVLRQVCQ